MGSLSSKKRNVKYLQHLLELKLGKKKGRRVLNAFIDIVNEYNPKLNKLWIDQGKELYKKLMIEWLDNNDILMYSTNNECKSVIAERCIKTYERKEW